MSGENVWRHDAIISSWNRGRASKQSESSSIRLPNQEHAESRKSNAEQTTSNNVSTTTMHSCRLKIITNLLFDGFSDKLQSTSFSTLLEFNMPALTALLRRQSEQTPSASYFNVDILKYQIKAKSGASSCPFQLVSYWKCEPTHTDIKIDYKYNNHAMAAASPLLNVALSVPVDGGVKNVQSKPHSAWLGESSRLVWNFTDISQHSDNNGVGTLRARCEVTGGPSTPAFISAQFNCEGTTLSGIEFELIGSGYRLSLVKRRFVSGKFPINCNTKPINLTHFHVNSQANTYAKEMASEVLKRQRHQMQIHQIRIVVPRKTGISTASKLHFQNVAFNLVIKFMAKTQLVLALIML